MSDEYDAALAVALRRLHASEKFEVELRSALGKFDAEIVDRVIEFLKDRGFVDDERTAKNQSERRTGKRAVGRGRLVDELTGRGATVETVERNLPSDCGDESDRIMEALAAKYGPNDSRARAARFLFARGFSEEA